MAKKIQAREVLEYLYRETIGRVITRTETYLYNPGSLVGDIYGLFSRWKYNLLKAVDPPPPQRKGENTLDYFDRIHPRFGLRHFGTMCAMGGDLNLTEAYLYYKETVKDKEVRTEILEFLTAYQQLRERNKEYLRRYKIRSQMLKDSS